MKSVKNTLKKYFIPHAENDHKPHFLRERTVIGTGVLVFALFLLSAIGNYAVKHNNYLASIQSAFLVDLANDDREDLGLARLAINDTLITAAGMKANDMAEKSYFAHVSPEGRTPWYWISLAGYNYLYAGENLAVNFYDSEEVQEAWMDSPTHKANIVSKNFTEIGIATASGMYKGDKTTFVVQMFGSQKKSPARVVEASSEDVIAPIEVAVAPITEENADDDSAVLGSEIEPIKPEPKNEIATVPTAPIIAQAESVIVDQTFTSTMDPDATPEEINASNEILAPEKEAYTNWFQRLLVSPNGIVQSLYVALAAIVIFALILKIFIEIRLQHPKNIAYGVLLLLVIVAFMHLNGGALAEPTLVVAF